MEKIPFSSEAIKKGIIPGKDLNEAEYEEFRMSIDPDSMGFDGKEGMEDDNNESKA